MHRRRKRPLKQSLMKASDILAVATREIGYMGKKSNASLYEKTANTSGKYTKYADELFKAGYYNGNKNGFDWCCVFVDWCIFEACDKDKEAAELVKPVSVYGAAVKFVRDSMPGRYDKQPQVGDQIIFKNSKGEYYHTGLVERIENGKVYTIEGNVTGSVVDRRIYDINSSLIDGYLHPYYEADDPGLIFERGDIVAIKPGIETNFSGVHLAGFVTDGRPLYVISSNATYTVITIDETLSAATATMWTEDLTLVSKANPPEEEIEGSIIFENNEDSPLPDIVVSLKEAVRLLEEAISKLE